MAFMRCVSFLALAGGMYYVQRGVVLIVMLGGGDKAGQTRDITAAKKLAAALVFKE